MTVRIINKSKHPLPAYATELSAGMDIRANLSGADSFGTVAALPWFLPVCTSLCRRGLRRRFVPAAVWLSRKVFSVLNSPGTIDADYRGEICIILVNLSSETFMIEDGERIAQMVIARHEQAVWQEVDVLDETERGAGGFGHTGV